MKLFVAGLPNDFDDLDFKEMFELYGTVLSAKIIVDHNTKKSKGFGFLDMPIDSEAQAVIATLNGVKMAGKPVVIKEATEQVQKPAMGNGFRPQRSNTGDSRPRFNNRDGNRGYSSNSNRDSNRNYNSSRNNNRNFNRDNQSDNRY